MTASGVRKLLMTVLVHPRVAGTRGVRVIGVTGARRVDVVRSLSRSRGVPPARDLLLPPLFESVRGFLAGRDPVAARVGFARPRPTRGEGLRSCLAKQKQDIFTTRCMFELVDISRARESSRYLVSSPPSSKSSSVSVVVRFMSSAALDWPLWVGEAYIVGYVHLAPLASTMARTFGAVRLTANFKNRLCESLLCVFPLSQFDNCPLIVPDSDLLSC